MKSGGPWNLRGLRPEAREAAREAARRSGMSVGEWLNTVIRPEDEDDGEWSGDFDRDSEDRWRQSLRDDERGRHGGSRLRRDWAPHDRRWRHAPDDDREIDRYRDMDRRGREEREYEPRPRHSGRPYRDEPGRRGGLYYEAPPRERSSQPPRAAERYEEHVAAEPPQDTRDSFVDQAVAEITARQRVLEGEVSFGDRPPQPLSSSAEHGRPAGSDGVPPVPASAPPVDLSRLEQQLRQITARIEALRPAKELETAIEGLRADLAEIGRSFTEALPRRALESLEIEIKALGQRIDHSRASGADAATLAGLERGLADVGEALRKLTPAEGLVGFEEAVTGLSRKVDAIVAKDDPAALQQLEAAIGALRGVVAHVASSEALGKVAEEVRALAGIVDGIAKSAASAPNLAAIEDRINTLAEALKASTEAGHAVPRELEKLLAGLVEKLEWVQLTQTDHTALAHLEDRIAMLVKRLDASDSRLGLLEGVERGLADLLVFMEQLRATKGAADGPTEGTGAAGAIEREVARTQDSLEAVQGTVEHVVDRLALLESDMRGDRAGAAAAESVPAKPQPQALATPPEPAPPASAAAAPAVVTVHLVDGEPELQPEPEPEGQSEPEPAAARHLAAARPPIDPSLPPDHPLEPGSAAGRSRHPPSAAARIAASEAAIGTKPPVIPDPSGGKSDFIAAARRAARAAALAASYDKPGAPAAAAATAPRKTVGERVRALIVAAAVVVIVVGSFHIVSRLFEDRGSGAPSPMHTQPPRLPAEPPRPLPEPPQVRGESAPTPVQPPPAPAEHSALPGAAAPAASPMHPPSTVPLPPTDTPPRAGASLTPSWLLGTVTGAEDDRQTLADAAGWPAAVLAGNPADLPGGSVLAGGPAQRWSDITGSLPQAALHPPAPLPAAAATAARGDALPAPIGVPALRAAALAGDPAAAYEVAVRYAEGRVVPQNNEAAARWFERAAKKGLAPAEFRLGSLYEKGIGVRKNLTMARDLYRAAAEKGHGKAMHNLGVLYAEGIDGQSDYRTAAQWFRKAAERGITDSQYNLAVLYARGVGVEQDLAEAYKWFFLAAREGDKDAARKRDEVAAHLDEQVLSAARIEVEKWTPLPQPADAISVKETWKTPVSETHPSRAKPPVVRFSAPGAIKID